LRRFAGGGPSRSSDMSGVADDERLSCVGFDDAGDG
jgi:hypothetical protein